MKKPKFKRKKKQKKQETLGPVLTAQNITDLLVSSRGPKVLVRDKQVVETETLSDDKREIEYDGKKLVHEVFVTRTTTRTMVIRERGKGEEVLEDFLNS